MLRPPAVQALDPAGLLWARRRSGTVVGGAGSVAGVSVGVGVELDALQAVAEADGRQCVAGALVLDPAGRVFVQRRGPDRRFLPGCWDIVGGHVEAGESILDALAREVEEETGWRVDGTPTLAYVADWETSDGGRPHRRREFDFVVAVAGDLARPRLEFPKQVEFRWLGPADTALLAENRGLDGGMVEQLVELAFRYAPSGRSTHPHLIAYVDPAVAGRVETLRAAWDPAMAAQIAAHVTVAYPEELAGLDRADLDRVAGAVPPFRLRLRGTAVGPDHWVYVEVDDLDGGWRHLRHQLVGGSDPVEAKPHVTLVHPRTTNRGDACWSAVRETGFEVDFTVRRVEFVAFDGGTWPTVSSLRLGQERST